MSTRSEKSGNIVKARARIAAAGNERATILDLSDLDLTSGDLAALIPEIAALTQLQKLYLHNNQLTALPPEIAALAQLQMLDLSNNQLMTLPPEIAALTQLQMLALHNNQLTALPPEIAGFAQLQTLDLGYNQLTALPPEIGQLTGLKGLFLHGNDALGIPPEVQGPEREKAEPYGAMKPARPADILNYYFSVQTAKAAGTLRAIGEVKVMLVGRGGAGKTSLRRFFLGQDHDPKEPETPGIALDDFPLRCKGREITAHLWDFAGQEITHALHQFFLTDGSIYILALDPRSNTEMADALYWLDQLKRYAGMAPVIVALNRQDARQGGYDVDRDLLRERYPQIREFVKTDCSKRAGCPELRDTLVRVIEGLSEMDPPWREVPKNWIEVKEACWTLGNIKGQHAQLPKHKLTFKEFRALCVQHKIAELEKQESLARILHALGVVLHFVEDPRLRDTSVLNPHWVTDGVYRLLRFKDRPASDGMLTLDEALSALEDQSAESARFLLDLMERFEMCFPLDGHPTSKRWLVPGSLNPYQPAGLGKQWQGPGAVRMRYDYGTPVAEGIIPRFIVLTHPLKGEQAWRNGVVLRDGDAAVLVRRGEKPNHIEVAAFGPEEDRLHLLEVVQGTMSRINADLPGKPPTIEQEIDGLPGMYKRIDDLRAAELEKVPVMVAAERGRARIEPTPQLDRTSEPKSRERDRVPLRTFLSYSHADRAAKNIWAVNLNVMQAKGLITQWHDGMIDPGVEWKKEIEGKLESMDLFIGLLTNNFVASSVIEKVELTAARERLKERGQRDFLFVLILVDNISLDGLKIAQYQLLTVDDKAVCDRKSRKVGFNQVQKKLEALIEKHMRTRLDSDVGKPIVAMPPHTTPGGAMGVTIIVEGDYNVGGKHMGNDNRINIGGNVINAQVGQTLTNCTNMVNQQAPGLKKDLLNALRGDIEELIKRLPEDKKDEAPQIAENLESVIKQATKEKPDRKWYSLSTEGLLEAAGWVQDFSGKIGGTIKNLGTMLWPDFTMPKLTE